MTTKRIPPRWPHQSEAIRCADGQHTHAIVLATGAGKTRVEMELAAKEIGLGRTPILVNGSRTMMTQLDRDAHDILPAKYVHFAYDTRQCGRRKQHCNCASFRLRGFCACDCGCGRYKGYERGRLNIESYERLFRRYDDMDLDPLEVTILVDEMHHAAYNMIKGHPTTHISRVLLHHVEQGGRVIGFTGTLWRLSREEGFRPIFDSIWNAGPIGKFIDDGILADYHGHLPARGRRWREQAMMGQAVSKKDIIDTFGDYRIEDAKGAPYPVSPELVVMEIQQSILEMGLGRIPQSLVYVPRISMAFRTAELLQAQGHRVAMLCSDPRWAKEAIDAGISTDPASVIHRFLSKDINIIVNVGIVTEGVDFPAAEMVLIGIATMSQVRWLQIIGRGLRRDGDKVCRLVDMTGNSIELGWPRESTIIQSLDHRGNKGEADEVLKKCSECESMWGTAKQVCDDCGYQFGRLCANCGVWHPWDYFGLSLTQIHVDDHEGWCDPCVWGEDDYRIGQQQMRERGLFPQFKTVDQDEIFDTMKVRQGVRWIIEGRENPKILLASLGGAKAPPPGFPCIVIAPAENRTYSGVAVASSKQDVAILITDPETAYAISEMIK